MNRNKKTIRLTENNLHNIIKESVNKVLHENESTKEERFWREVQHEMSNVARFSDTLINTVNSLEMENESEFNDTYALENSVKRLSELLNQAKRAYNGKLGI